MFLECRKRDSGWILGVTLLFFLSLSLSLSLLFGDPFVIVKDCG